MRHLWEKKVEVEQKQIHGNQAKITDYGEKIRAGYVTDITGIAKFKKS